MNSNILKKIKKHFISYKNMISNIFKKIKKHFISYKNYYLSSPKKNALNYKPNPSYILEVINLCKKYKPNSPWIINNLNFHIKKGEFHAFIGGNGAGKTTTIKSVIGAYAKFDGCVYIAGKNNFNKESKKFMGYIPEIARFPDGMSARNYLISMCEMSGLSHHDSVKYTDKKLKEFNMQRLAKKSPNNFSSGQKKKILLAQALVHNPDLLIMDEPAANLDPIARIEFFNILKKLQKEGKAIFISSHILSELDKFADTCTVLDGGKIVYTGKVESDIPSYVININNKKKDELFNLLKQNNLDFDELDEFEWVINNFSNLVFLEELKNNEFIFNYFKHKRTLENIYNTYVIKGSIETMKHV